MIDIFLTAVMPTLTHQVRVVIGTIPIIRRNRPYTDIYTDAVGVDLPIVMVDEWTGSAITEALLRQWHQELYPFFLDSENRQKMLHWLSMDYWVDYIRHF